jgi:hypothetical protein
LRVVVRSVHETRGPGLGDECAEWVVRRFPFEAHVDELERILRRQARSSVEG